MRVLAGFLDAGVCRSDIFDVPIKAQRNSNKMMVRSDSSANPPQISADLGRRIHPRFGHIP